MSRTPTKAELAGAYGKVIPDLVAPDLRVLLVGINPSLWSGWSGRHFGRPKAVIGPQPEDLAGVPLWVLPNPSGLNAHYQQPALSAEYAKLAAAVG